jgi:predicted RNA-binding Zn ribbon-like protein
MVSQTYDPRFQRLADGLVLPAAIAGDPILDFCNTQAGWAIPEPREYLTSYDHLAVWAREAALISAAETTRLRGRAQRGAAGAAANVLERALALRSAVYAACTDPSASGAWETVGTEARDAAAAAVLAPDAAPGRRWRISERAGLEQPLHALAWAAGAFLDATDLRLVGRCPGTDCGWLFLDPRRRRRWCTMAVCGNRAKARRHARRVRC